MKHTPHALAIILSLFALTACPANAPAPLSNASPSSTPGVVPSTSPSEQPDNPTINPIPAASSFLPPSPSSIPDAEETTQAISLPDGSQLALSIPNRFFSTVGQTQALKVTLKAPNGQPISLDTLKLRFRSSRPQDFSIDDQGKITALTDNGFSEISVQIEDTTLSITQLVSAYSDVGGYSGSSGTKNKPQPSVSFSLSGNTALGPGALIKLSGSARNLGNDSLSYAWSCLEANCNNFSPNNTAQSYWTVPDTAGVYTLLLQVSNNLNTVQTTRTITVTTETANVSIEGTLPIQ